MVTLFKLYGKCTKIRFHPYYQYDTQILLKINSMQNNEHEEQQTLQ